MFQLSNEPRPRRYVGRIGIIEAFLEREIWDAKTVNKVHNVINHRGWDNNSPPEWLDILDKAHELIATWHHIDKLTSNGSLRHGLTRQPKSERIKVVLRKLESHGRWRMEKILKSLKYKQYKSREARRKQFLRVEEAREEDPIMKRLDKLRSSLNNQLREV